MTSYWFTDTEGKHSKLKKVLQSIKTENHAGSSFQQFNDLPGFNQSDIQAVLKEENSHPHEKLSHLCSGFIRSFWKYVYRGNKILVTLQNKILQPENEVIL